LLLFNITIYIASSREAIHKVVQTLNRKFKIYYNKSKHKVTKSSCGKNFIENIAKEKCKTKLTKLLIHSTMPSNARS